MREINTEINITASAARVWAVLTDFSSYPEWNRFVREISGEPHEGSYLRVKIKPEGGMGASLMPVVVAAEPEKRFAWRGKLGVTGLFDGMHEFIIEPASEGSVRFVHREEFSGLLVPLLWPLLEKNTRRGFKDMNEGLKNRAESNRQGV